MNRKNLQTENHLPEFPEESGLIVGEILEKYGLAELQKKEIERILNVEDPTEKIQIFENLPGTKISKLIKEYAEGKVSLDEISDQIAKRLNIQEKTAKQIAKDLEKSLLKLITPYQKTKLLEEKPFKTIGEILFKSGEDSHREPIK